MESSAQEFNLAYCKMMMTNLSELRQSTHLCDINLKIKSTIFPAHKVVLSACSPYFKAMFTQNLAEKNQSIVEFKGIDILAMEMILNFAYTGILNVSAENVQLLLPAARLLQVKCIVEQCTTFLNSQLHPSNCIGIYRLSELYSLHVLQQSAWKYINQNFEEVYKQDEFHECPFHIIQNIIMSDDVNLISEESMFYAVQLWVLWDLNTRDVNLASLLQCVRLPLINRHFLTECLHSNKLIENDVDAQKLFVKAIEYLNASNDSMTTTPKFNQSQLTARCAPKALFAIGGKKGLFATLSSVEAYLPSLGAWQDLPHLPEARYECGVIATDRKIYVIGGIICSNRQNIPFREHSNSVTVWDPESNIWKCSKPMIKCRSGFAITLLKGEIYVLGGYDGELYLNEVERYCPRLNTWSRVANMHHTRTSFAAAALNDNIYAMGGYGPMYKNSVERYNAQVGVWELSTAMLSKRMSFGACVLKGSIYVVGGHSGSNQLQSVEKYDTVHNNWTICTTLPTPRTGVGSSVLNDKIYVIGGHSGQEYLDLVECFDPSTSEWTTVSPMNSQRCNFGMVAL